MESFTDINGSVHSSELPRRCLQRRPTLILVVAALTSLGVLVACEPDYSTPRDGAGVPVPCAIQLEGRGGLFDEFGGLVEAYVSEDTGYFACKDKEAADGGKIRTSRVDRISDGNCPPVEGGIEETEHCETDAQCAVNEACICGLSYADPSLGSDSVDAGGDNNECYPAECRSADDCGGWPCAVSRTGCLDTSGLFCMSEADECASHMDCDDRDRPDCGYDESAGHWKCQPRYSECD